MPSVITFLLLSRHSDHVFSLETKRAVQSTGLFLFFVFLFLAILGSLGLRESGSPWVGPQDRPWDSL